MNSLYSVVKVKSTLSNYMEKLQMYNIPRFESIRTEVLQHRHYNTPIMVYPVIRFTEFNGIQVPSGIHQRDQYAAPKVSLRRTKIEQNGTTNSDASWIDTLNLNPY